MNIALWIAASLLALAFVASGFSKIALSPEALLHKGYAWVEDFSPEQVKMLGLAETLGGMGLVLPPAVGIFDVLGPIAAACLALFMVGAVIVHIRRGETQALLTPVILATLCSGVAILRFGPYNF